MDGTIDTEELIRAINRHAAPMAACAQLIRETDRMVGSLNVQIAVGPMGTEAELQSPVNPRAEACLREVMRAWSLAEAGQGRAMVLLMLEPEIGAAAAPTEER